MVRRFSPLAIAESICYGCGIVTISFSSRTIMAAIGVKETVAVLADTQFIMTGIYRNRGKRLKKYGWRLPEGRELFRKFLDIMGSCPQGILKRSISHHVRIAGCANRLRMTPISFIEIASKFFNHLFIILELGINGVEQLCSLSCFISLFILRCAISHRRIPDMIRSLAKKVAESGAHII